HDAAKDLWFKEIIADDVPLPAWRPHHKVGQPNKDEKPDNSPDPPGQAVSTNAWRCEIEFNRPCVVRLDSGRHQNSDPLITISSRARLSLPQRSRISW